MEAWCETAEIVKNYSEDMVTRWSTEMDTLLVYVSCDGVQYSD